ncbi:hypothetical protein Slin15195_G099550 [Septoria linicola]|uniref:Uncharacterized protein n=1 Tax=Septoria linicola TaxID=215465 RepID=A0A9Q9B5D5_9PEZI|nr:hypothetical protein Slin15195_G099550 [Septoria linicola]
MDHAGQAPTTAADESANLALRAWKNASTTSANLVSPRSPDFAATIRPA